MEITKHFPIQGFSEVEVNNEKLKIKYRYPTRKQVQLMGDESNHHGYAMAICKYCIEEIEGLTSDGQVVKPEKDPDGTLSDDFVVLLYNNGLAIPLAAFYSTNHAPTAFDKKKFSSSPPASVTESPSVSG